MKTCVRTTSRILTLALAAGMILSACTPTVSQRGFLPDPEKSETITPGKDNKLTVRERWGSPSTISTFDDNTWYYISSKQIEEAFFLPETVDQKVTVVEFDKGGNVTQVAQHDLSQAQKINIVNRETPTRGRELSFLEQIFGNIGRVGAGGTEAEKPGR